jgi:hypothetical protein
MAARNRGVLPLQQDFDSTKLDKDKHSVTRTIGAKSLKPKSGDPETVHWSFMHGTRQLPCQVITLF